MSSPSGKHEPAPSDSELGVKDTDLGCDDSAGASVSIGGRVGRFVVVDRLGEGGMGSVLLADDPKLERRVALKVLKTANSNDARERLLREAQAMAKIQHPNVVTVFDVGEQDEQVFIAMELVEGGTFRDWLDARGADDEVAPWRDVLEVLIPAGRGLAAAHKHKLVHRDFKPENILLSSSVEDIKVADFGLVSIKANESQEDIEKLMKEASGSVDAAGRLTQAGTVVGTPNYMSPEQFAGRPLDARVDQFAFCIVLYEALYGVRPFRSNSLFDLALNVRAGDVEPRPEGSEVPGWLEELVLRGLAPDPGGRFPSMKALLDELSRERKSRLRYLAAAGAMLVAAGGVAWALQGSYAPAAGPVCQDSQERLEGVWDGEVQGAIKQAFEGTGVSYAGQVWENVRGVMDTHGERWVSMRTEACEATRVHKTQSVELMDLRMACLERRLQDMSALVHGLMEADTMVLAYAAEAARSLESLERCSLAAVAAASAPESVPSELRARVTALQLKLSEAQTAGELGRRSEGIALANEVYREAASMELASLAAEALLVRGTFEHRDGLYDASVETLMSSVTHAQSVGNEATELSAQSEMVYVIGCEQFKSDEARRWGTLAEAKLQKLGSDVRAKAKLDLYLGSTEFRGHDIQAAEKRFRAARDTLDKTSDALSYALAVTGLGHVAMAKGDLDKALDLHREALEVRVDSLGKGHPYTSESLNNIGSVYVSLGETEKARGMLEEALQIAETGFGEDHPDVADALNNLGAVEISEGSYEEAVEFFERAIPIIEDNLGRNNPDLAITLVNLASAYLLLDFSDKGVAALERALLILQASSAAQTSVAEVQFFLARAVHQASGDTDRARQLAVEAAKAFEDAPDGVDQANQIRDWLADLDLEY